MRRLRANPEFGEFQTSDRLIRPAQHAASTGLNRRQKAIVCPTSAELHVARRAMGCEFLVVLPGGARNPVGAGCAALDEVERLEELLSVYREDSEVCRLNREAQDRPVQVDPEVYRLLRVACGISVATGGAFDPAAGALVKAWGFFRGPRRVPADVELEAARKATG